MVSATSSVGSTTAVCALSDQVKKYRARVLQNGQESASDAVVSRPTAAAIPFLLLMCLVVSDRFCLEPKASSVPRKFFPGGHGSPAA